MAQDYSPQRRRSHTIHAQVHKLSGKGPPQLLRIFWILQHQCALHVRAAVKSRGQLEMALPDSSDFFQHSNYGVRPHRAPSLSVP